MKVLKRSNRNTPVQHVRVGTGNNSSARQPTIQTLPRGAEPIQGVIYRRAEPEPREEALALEPGELFERALARLKAQLQSRNTKPSQPEWNGLEQITLAIEGMADRHLSPQFYLSSLAPGVGKTSAVCCTIKEMMEMDKYRETSAIIFLSRCEEIERLRDHMELKDADYAVLVNEDGDYSHMNEWGNQNPRTARVLFATQQRLRRYLENRDRFADISEFYYRDQPRQVRVWDEAILPSNALTLSANEIARLFGRCARQNKEIEAHLKSWYDLLSEKEALEGALFDADKLIRKIPFDTFLSWFDTADKRIATTVWKLSGKAASVRMDNFGGNTIVHYEDAFPDDFAPLLILDASGLLRETYKHWFQSRGGLHYLPSPKKGFARLTIGHWDHAAGRSGNAETLNAQWDEVADGIANKIAELPKTGNVLVVSFLPDKKIGSLQHRMAKRIGTHKRIQYLTWGRHTATNDYHDCKHVFLAGILQYAASDYEAVGRGAKGVGPFTKFTDEEHRETRLGEIKHNILQAACRGALRKSDGNQCPGGCTLWVVYSSHPTAGTPRSLLGEIFPGATVTGWLPLGGAERLKPLLDRVMDFLNSRTESITVPALANVLGMKDQSRLNKLIKTGPFKRELTRVGWNFVPGYRGRFDKA